MTELLYIGVFMVGCALGCVVAMLLGSRRLAEAQMETERLRVELSGLQQLRDAESAQTTTLRDDFSRLQGEYTRTLSALERHKSALEGEQKRYQEEASRHEELREQHRNLRCYRCRRRACCHRSRHCPQRSPRNGACCRPCRSRV